MKEKKNVYEVITKDERFRILSKILESTGIGEAMSKEKEIFTFFAPTDEAFCKLSKKALKILISPEGKELFAAIMGQHLVPKSYFYSDDLRRKDSVETMNGNKLKINEKANVLRLEEAHILMPGIAASNGVVFPVDKIIPARRKTVLPTKI
ncbi:MAG: fasciclin domain-containing protein [Pyrinomonadaceae bacterium]